MNKDILNKLFLQDKDTDNICCRKRDIITEIISVLFYYEYLC